MASVFTFDPDPPRVESPWLFPNESDKDSLSKGHKPSSSGSLSAAHGLLSEYGVTKLEAEPQNGPTEYKLHLLFRPRRRYTYISTMHADGCPPAPQLSSSQQSRQSRLQHLTTQLLWRLQQSSRFHASTSRDLAVPWLPDDSEPLERPVQIGRLVSGLEESRGALYEIGVSDDGTLVGLTQDEMDESITTLIVMAASLGCRVEIVRSVIVGECEWAEEAGYRQAKLWVFEALVTPDLGPRDHDGEEGGHGRENRHEHRHEHGHELEFKIDHLRSTSLRRTPCQDGGQDGDVATASVPGSGASEVAMPEPGRSMSDQLRITLTGPTTSGKSTLLGTLSTGTLDNGRGKSRLSLLKHRHEVASGITSSVAQELIGYKDHEIYNYSHDSIGSWVEIHDRTDGGRLVFVSDSAGHPRYRRTVLRGLVGWDPHWTILCIAADDGVSAPGQQGASSSARDLLGIAGAGVDMAQAHLDLCLRLGTPLVVVITKLDLATKASLQLTMGKILTALKAARRSPRILQPDQKYHSHLTRVPSEDYDKIRPVMEALSAQHGATSIVPIILTSAVKGTGIGITHALLEALPLARRPTSYDFIGMKLNPEQPQTLFHIDDTFNLPTAYALLGLPTATSTLTTGTAVERSLGIVVSGYLRFGSLSVGDLVIIGPFPNEEDDSRFFSTPAGALTSEAAIGSPGHGLSVSHPSSSELARIASRNAISASTIRGEWHDAHVVSIRNLRLPVCSLGLGQVGSVGIVVSDATARLMRRIRKGMVIAVPSRHMIDTGISLQAASGLTVRLDYEPAIAGLVPGSLVNIYVAAVRAAARVLTTSRVPGTDADQPFFDPSDDDCVEKFNHGDDEDDEDAGRVARSVGSEAGSDENRHGGVVEVGLELLSSREWIEMGARILVMEGGRKDRSGLEGFVGWVVEIVD